MYFLFITCTFSHLLEIISVNLCINGAGRLGPESQGLSKYFSFDLIMRKGWSTDKRGTAPSTSVHLELNTNSKACGISILRQRPSAIITVNIYYDWIGLRFIKITGKCIPSFPNSQTPIPITKQQGHGPRTVSLAFLWIVSWLLTELEVTLWPPSSLELNTISPS